MIHIVNQIDSSLEFHCPICNSELRWSLDHAEWSDNSKTHIIVFKKSENQSCELFPGNISENMYEITMVCPYCSKQVKYEVKCLGNHHLLFKK